MPAKATRVGRRSSRTKGVDDEVIAGALEGIVWVPNGRAPRVGAAQAAPGSLGDGDDAK